MPRYWSVDEAWTATDHSPELEREIGRSLSDEVAIDFPSMRGPIGRMRAGFGDTVEAEPMVALVQLSARQAGTGVKVPIDVPLARACAGCGGRGETWNAACHPCEGTGTTIERYSRRQRLLRAAPAVRSRRSAAASRFAAATRVASSRSAACCSRKRMTASASSRVPVPVAPEIR